MELSQKNGEESQQSDHLLYLRLENYIDLAQAPDLYTFCKLVGVDRERIEDNPLFGELVLKLYGKSLSVRVDDRFFGNIATSGSNDMVFYSKKWVGLYGGVPREKDHNRKHIKRQKYFKVIKQVVIALVAYGIAIYLAYLLAMIAIWFFGAKVVMP